jgi:hypothetical protein
MTEKRAHSLVIGNIKIGLGEINMNMLTGLN